MALQTSVEEFEERGAFASEEAARELLTHLTAVEQFEQQGDMAKVVEHMESFYHLLDNQQENEQITEEAYQALTEEADAFMEQWTG
ncbi:FIMAH domain-containing protein [Salicibibacter cibi]|uniref:FIMAH domain-containing protein n=1 Tax=Salicibibacter cibi TaxID=2743001 RepID=UPI003CCCA15A